MVIDCHTHIFSPDVAQNRDKLCSADFCFGLLYSSPKAKLPGVEELIRSMDEREIQRSVILNIGWETHEKCLRTNDYILDSIARYPSRLIGFCSVQPLEQKQAVDEIVRCRRAGAVGIGELRPDAQGYELNDAGLMDPVAQCLVENGMFLSLHASEPVGHSYAGKGGMTPGTLYSFIERNPLLKIIMAHFGGGMPFYELMPEVGRALKNTFYDTAAAPYLYSPQIYKTLLPIVGSGRILFGSDWPLLDPMKVIEHIKSGDLADADLQKITRSSATRLFGR